MTHEPLKSWILRQSFQPFEIRMSNGQRYPVLHPEYAALGKTNLILFYPESDRYKDLSLLHVASVEKLEVAKQARCDPQKGRGVRLKCNPRGS